MNSSNATALTQPGVPMKVRNVSKRFGAFTALDNVSLEVAAGELVCLLGPSGCGKTTLLRCIAGLERQDNGALYLGDRDVSELAPQARDYGILFQSYALFPNLTVEANIAYGLAGSNREVVRKRVGDMLELVGLTGSEKKFPGQLSGGQQQRVALARALAPSPSLLLLDEPMSALDARVREHLCTELRQLQRHWTGGRRSHQGTLRFFAQVQQSRQQNVGANAYQCSRQAADDQGLPLPRQQCP